MMKKFEEKLKKSMDVLKQRNEQLDRENLALHDKIAHLEAQLKSQQPEVPPFVADWLTLIEENAYMVTHEQANKHKKAIAWLEERQSDLMLLKCLLIGYTVEKPKTIVSPCPVCGYEDVKANFCGMCGHKNEYVEAVEEKRFYLKHKSVIVYDCNCGCGNSDTDELYLMADGNFAIFKEDAYKFTQSEIDSMAAESYEQLEVEE